MISDVIYMTAWGILFYSAFMDFLWLKQNDRRLEKLERHSFGYHLPVTACVTCKQPFRTGETVSVQNGNNYHARCLPPR